MKQHFATEWDLVQGLLRKDNLAVAYLYSNYSFALKKVITEIIKEEEMVEDVFQQCMVSIWQKIDQYDAGKGRLFTWMLNICRNASIDTLRSKSFRQMQNQTSLDSVYDIQMGISSTKTDTIGLQKIIYSLPEDNRKPLILNYLEGYTHDEIAKMLQWPVGTVKTRIRNGLIQLRKKMVQ
jgi:RNA polymerase sigma factor (sigma-70 family)